jgi:hypothetical protein
MLAVPTREARAEGGAVMRTRPPSEASIIAAITRHVEVNGKAMKYAALIDALKPCDHARWLELYDAAGPILQRLKSCGCLELVKGRGAGWTIPREASKAVAK